MADIAIENDDPDALHRKPNKWHTFNYKEAIRIFNSGKVNFERIIDGCRSKIVDGVDDEFDKLVQTVSCATGCGCMFPRKYCERE